MSGDPASRVAARYGADQPAAAQWNETLDLLLSHRSVRAFLPEAVPDGMLETLVAAAQSASTSSNLQAWSVVAVEDAERKSRLAALAAGQRHVAAAPLLLIWLVDHARLSGLAVARGAPSEGLGYLEGFLLGVVDAALAAQNTMTALESLGLGGCYIGAMRNHPAEVAAELGLPPQVFALFGMAVGWPDPARPAVVKPRLPQAAVLSRERYDGGPTQQAAIAAYDERLKSFQRAQAMKEQDWSAQATRRVRDGAALTGRDVLRAVLERLGFGLR